MLQFTVVFGIFPFASTDETGFLIPVFEEKRKENQSLKSEYTVDILFHEQPFHMFA